MKGPRKPIGPQAGLLIALLVLASYYAAVFRPLVEKEKAQTAPFEAMQAKLRAAATNNPAISGLSDEILVRIEASLLESSNNLARARSLVSSRHAPEATITAQLSRPFQLIDYQNERLKRIERLNSLAAERKVALAPAAVAGLPEFTVENPTPELLWGQLSLADGLMRAALASGVASVEKIVAAAPVTHPVPASSAERLVELPLRLEVVGGFDAVTRLLAVALSEPAGRAGLKLPEVEGLPAVTLGPILLRKETATPAGALRLSVEFHGFLQLPNPPTP